jgi:hypothetical protein
VRFYCARLYIHFSGNRNFPLLVYGGIIYCSKGIHVVLKSYTDYIDKL